MTNSTNDPGPVMRGVAAWLVENTSLTFDQISAYAGVHRFEVQCMADGTLSPMPTFFSPIGQGWLTQEDIDAAQADQQMPVPVSAKRDRSLKLRRSPWIDPLGDEIVTDVRVVRLYFAFYGRNAWYSIWGQRYLSQGSVCPSLEVAKDVAEHGRRQGNVWHIDELPGFLVQTNRRSFAITEINNKNQSLQLSDVVAKASTWWDALNLTRRFVRDSVTCVTVDRPISIPKLVDEQFHQHKAFPRGSGQRLGWDRRAFSPDNVGAIQACVSKARRFIGRSSDGSADAEDGVANATGS